MDWFKLPDSKNYGKSPCGYGGELRYLEIFYSNQTGRDINYNFFPEDILNRSFNLSQSVEDVGYRQEIMKDILFHRNEAHDLVGHLDNITSACRSIGNGRRTVWQSKSESWNAPPAITVTDLPAYVEAYKYVQKNLTQICKTMDSFSTSHFAKLASKLRNIASTDLQESWEREYELYQTTQYPFVSLLDVDFQTGDISLERTIGNVSKEAIEYIISHPDDSVSITIGNQKLPVQFVKNPTNIVRQRHRARKDIEKHIFDINPPFPGLKEGLSELERDLVPLCWYMRGLDYAESLESQGLEYTFAEFSSERNMIKITDGYPLFLESDNYAPLSVSLNKDQNFAFLSGNNFGGKSTLLRMIKSFIHMGYSGLPVPAKECVLSPTSQLIHREDTTDEVGVHSKMSKSSEEIRELFEEVSKDAIILWDETFNGTDSESQRDGLESIATGMSLSGLRGIFVTHESDSLVHFKENKLFPKVQFLRANDEDLGEPKHGITEGIGKSKGIKILREYGADKDSISRIVGERFK